MSTVEFLSEASNYRGSTRSNLSLHSATHVTVTDVDGLCDERCHARKKSNKVNATFICLVSVPSDKADKTTACCK